MSLTQTMIVWPEWVAAQEPAQWLTPWELTTLASWSSDKRRREWLAGRLAAKRLMGEEFGLSPRAYAIGREGVAPCLTGQDCPPIILSLSHGDGLGAASWSAAQAEGTVGIDIQQVRPVHAGLCARVFTSEEQAQIRVRWGASDSQEGLLLFWAVKEAALKTRRAPWGRPLREIVVTQTGQGTASVQMPGEPQITAAFLFLNGAWLVRAIRPPIPAIRGK